MRLPPVGFRCYIAGQSGRLARRFGMHDGRASLLAKKVRTASPPRGRGKPQIRALGAAALALALACPAVLQAEEAAEDRVFLEKRLSKILEFERTGAEIPWSNPKTGNSGKIQLMRTYFLDP